MQRIRESAKKILPLIWTELKILAKRNEFEKKTRSFVSRKPWSGAQPSLPAGVRQVVPSFEGEYDAPRGQREQHPEHRGEAFGAGAGGGAAGPCSPFRRKNPFPSGSYSARIKGQRTRSENHDRASGLA